MQWEGREESENVEDRRGIGGTGLAVGGGVGVVVVIVCLMLGVDPRQFVGGGGGGGRPKGPPDPAEERLAHFTKVVMHDTETIWDDLFRQHGKTYRKPTLVMFTGQVNSACGSATAA